VEGTGRGRGHRLALPNGRLLRGHEGPADAPGPRRSVGRHDRSAVGSTYRLSEMRSIGRLVLYAPKRLDVAFSEGRR
jgi:hypothetical protein